MFRRNTVPNPSRQSLLKTGGAVILSAAVVVGAIWAYNHLLSSDVSSSQRATGAGSLQVPGGNKPFSKQLNAVPEGHGASGQSMEVSVSGTRAFLDRPVVFSIYGGDGATPSGQHLPPITVQWQFPHGAKVRALTPLVETPYGQYSTPGALNSPIAKVVTQLRPSSNALDQQVSSSDISVGGSWAVTPPPGASTIPVEVKLANGWHRFSIPLHTVWTPFAWLIHTRFAGLDLRTGVDEAIFGYEGVWNGTGKAPALPPGVITYSIGGTATGLTPQTRALPSADYTSHWVDFTVPLTPSSRGIVVQTVSSPSTAINSLLINNVSGNWGQAGYGPTNASILPRYNYVSLGKDAVKFLVHDWYWLLLALIAGGYGVWRIHEHIVEKRSDKKSMQSYSDVRDLNTDPNDPNFRAR